MCSTATACSSLCKPFRAFERWSAITMRCSMARVIPMAWWASKFLLARALSRLPTPTTQLHPNEFTKRPALRRRLLRNWTAAAAPTLVPNSSACSSRPYNICPNGPWKTAIFPRNKALLNPAVRKRAYSFACHLVDDCVESRFFGRAKLGLNLRGKVHGEAACSKNHGGRRVCSAQAVDERRPGTHGGYHRRMDSAARRHTRTACRGQRCRHISSGDGRRPKSSGKDPHQTRRDQADHRGHGDAGHVFSGHRMPGSECHRSKACVGLRSFRGVFRIRVCADGWRAIRRGGHPLKKAC